MLISTLLFIIDFEATRRRLESIIKGLTISEKDAGSIVGEDSLLHLETLFVVASGDSEDVSFELLAEAFTIDFLTHSSVEERTATQRECQVSKSHALLCLALVIARDGTYMYFSSSISIFFWPPVVGSLMLNYRQNSSEPSEFRNRLPSSLKKGVRDPYFGKYNKLAD